MAKKRIAATPGLRGRGMAVAGLVIGYLWLGFMVAAVVAGVVFVNFVAHKRGSLLPARDEPRSAILTHSSRPMPAQDETTDTEPDGSGWTMKLTGVEAPGGAVTGRIHGQSFKIDKATLGPGGWLNLTQGKDFLGDLEMSVVVFESDFSKLSGRTFVVPKQEFGLNPHIWMKWKQAGGNAQQQRCFTDGYALRLEFGQFSGGKLPGKIYLCVPDKEKSFVAGTFEAQTK